MIVLPRIEFVMEKTVKKKGKSWGIGGDIRIPCRFPIDIEGGGGLSVD
jgi:putative transposon-encoded protein